MPRISLSGNAQAPKSFDVLPKGWYLGRVIESELRQNKSTPGSHFLFTIEIDTPAFRSRLLWARHQYENPNPQSAEIGEGQMNALARACGFEPTQVQDTSQLHQIQMELKVDIQAANNGYPESNQVTDYRMSRVSASPPTPGAAPRPSGSGVRPGNAVGPAVVDSVINVAPLENDDDIPF